MVFSVIGKKFFCGCMIIGGVLTACVSEAPSAGNEEPVVTPPSDLYRMGFNALEGNYSDSRASVDEDSLNSGQNNVFRWDAGDRIMIWTGGNAAHLTPCLFTTQDGGLTSARFEYEGEKMDSYTYFGYYPYAEGLQYNEINVTVPTDGAILQAEKNDSRHLGAYRPMYTSVVTRNENSPELTGLTFRHLTGLLYFRIRNLSGKDSRVESVTLRCSEKVFSNHAVLKFIPESPEQEAQFNVSGASLSESVSLSLGSDKQGVVLFNGEIMQAFLPLLPVENLAGKKLTLILKADGHDHVSLELDGDAVKAFEKATYYRFGVTVTHDGIEIEPIISDWEPGDDIDIPVE